MVYPPEIPLDGFSAVSIPEFIPVHRSSSPWRRHQSRNLWIDFDKQVGCPRWIWYRIALWHTISGRFLVFLGGMLLAFLGGDNFYRLFFPQQKLLKMVKKKLLVARYKIFGGCLRWEVDFPHSKMTIVDFLTQVMIESFMMIMTPPKKIPSGKHTKSYEKSPFLMGKSTINGPFSIAMLVYQRVEK